MFPGRNTAFVSRIFPLSLLISKIFTPSLLYLFDSQRPWGWGGALPSLIIASASQAAMVELDGTQCCSPAQGRPFLLAANAETGVGTGEGANPLPFTAI